MALVNGNGTVSAALSLAGTGTPTHQRANIDVVKLIAQFRREQDDPEKPGNGDDCDSLWSDADILKYMDQAQKEFARRTRLLRGTASVFFNANDPWGDLPDRVIKLHRGTLASNGRKVVMKEFHELDGGYAEDDYGTTTVCQWETNVGEPTMVVTDLEKDKLRAVPIPSAADTMNFTVDRLPWHDITAIGSTLEILDYEHQCVMIEYMRHLAYLKHDADTYDKDQSDEMLERFGLSAAMHSREVTTKRTRVGTVRYGGL